MKYTVLIPARMASSRLPGKPLVDIAGLPMVVRVAHTVREGLPSNVRIVVAADCTEIIEVCHVHGVEAILTRNDHLSGSDRLAEASEILSLADEEIVVNVQGDEPLIEPELVDQVATLLSKESAAVMGTAACHIDNVADFMNLNIVKVVLNARGMALYFSRSPIPCWRDMLPNANETLSIPQPLRHIGIYSYRVDFLRSFPRMAQAPIEVAESLEQLRALWHGYNIAVHQSTKAPSPGVDTPEDLDRVRQIFSRQRMVLQ